MQLVMRVGHRRQGRGEVHRKLVSLGYGEELAEKMWGGCAGWQYDVVSARGEKNGGRDGQECPVVVVAAWRLGRYQHGDALRVMVARGCGCGGEEGSGVVAREMMVRIQERCAG